MIVEDTRRLARTLERALGELFPSVRSCGTVAAAIELLDAWRPDLVLLDVDLPDGNAFEVLEHAAELAPSPVFVAMSGVASTEASFRLAQLGVRAYLQKPFRLDALERALDEALSRPPDVTPHLRAAVGQVSLRELEQHVRRTMVDEALARTGGNRRGAARLLDVSRQLLQHIIRALE